MLDLFNQPTPLLKETFYWFCALAGSGMFLIQFLISLVGVDHSDEGEIDASKFKWLSKQAFTGFLMMFGWVGLTCRNEFALSKTVSALFAIAGGMAAVIASGLIFKMAKKLRSTGTVFRIDDAIGKEAVVYQRISKDSAGKVSVSLHNHTHEIDAVSLSMENIDSFTSVQIIKKMDDKTVVVVPLK